MVRHVGACYVVSQPCCLTCTQLQIDGNSERVLLQRFGVEVFPSLFFIQGVETRPCHDRSLEKVTVCSFPLSCSPDQRMRSTDSHFLHDSS